MYLTERIRCNCILVLILNEYNTEPDSRLEQAAKIRVESMNLSQNIGMGYDSRSA